MKKIPEFRSREEEKAYWAENGSPTGERQEKEPYGSAPGLRHPEKAVSLRLPGAMLEELRVQASLLDVPARSLVKSYLTERMEREMRKERLEKDSR